jgi:hypothetical protein
MAVTPEQRAAFVRDLDEIVYQLERIANALENLAYGEAPQKRGESFSLSDEYVMDILGAVFERTNDPMKVKKQWDRLLAERKKKQLAHKRRLITRRKPIHG